MDQKDKILKAIKQIATQLKGQNIKWLIGGSGSLLVHGLDVIPNDIDVIIDPEYYKDAKYLLKDILVGIEEVDGDQMRHRFKIDYIEGELKTGHIDTNLLSTKIIDGVEISVHKLKVEYDYYKRRTDKIEANKLKIKLIEKALGLK